MDVYESDTEETQATQILQELLEHDVMKNRKPGKSRSSLLHTNPAQSNDISSESRPSSRASNSIPQYNLHGLASTQSQSQQYREEEELEEGSQKENIGSSRLAKDTGRSNTSPASRSESPPPSSSNTNAQAKGRQAERLGNSNTGNDKATKKLATKVTFQPNNTKSGLKATTSKPATRFSPYKPPPQAPSRYKQPPRPVSPASQDSFAGEIEDNEERFLARSEKFAVPLSELGHSSPVRGTADTNSRSYASSMYAYPTPGRQRHVPSSPPTGRVLVEATPSDSSQSQDEEPKHTHEWVETQPSGEPDPVDHRTSRSPPMQAGGAPASNSSDSDSEGPSSFERALRGDVDPPPPPPAAQMAAIQPDERAMQYQTGQTATTTGGQSTGARSLYSTLAAEKRYRYRSYAEQSEDARLPSIRTDNFDLTPHDAVDMGPETQPSTQPTFSVQRVRTLADMPPPRLPTNNRPQQVARGPSPHAMDVDVIPDSEPQRDERNLGGGGRSPSKRAGPSATNKAPTTARKKDDDKEMAPLPEDMAEEEEDEDDVPLAARNPQGRPTQPKATNKGKGKAKEVVKTAQEKMPAPVAPVARGRPARGQASTSAKPMSGSWETGVVPSSVPDQDVPAPRNDARARSNDSTSSRATKRSTSGAPKSGRRQRANAEDSDYDKDGDDAHDEAESGPSRKRKRVAAAAKPKKNTKASQKRVKQESATPAAGTRQAQKLLRSATSKASYAPNAPATRVLALWKQDGHFYPGTVHSVIGHGRYSVTFDDTTDGEVTIEQMRLCHMNIGDEVLYVGRNRPAKVTAVDDADDPRLITVDTGHCEEVIKINDVRIASKTITYSWEDRILKPEDIIPEVKPVKLEPSPPHSKVSVASLANTQGLQKKILDKTGLILTLSSATENHEKEKEKVNSAILQCGGGIVEDFSNVICMEGKHVGKSWILEQDDVKWIGKPDIHRLFLLADDANQKPKFLIALALGIPCVGTSWVFESLQSGQEKEWLSYLLPQGYSSALSARPSQQVDVDWGNSIHHLKHIMKNSVPRKVFAGMSVLCVGHDVVRQPKTKRKAGADDKMDGSNAIPQIILAMGASRVEAVTEVRHATKALTEYDYIVIREENQYSAEYGRCVTVDWNWVKESLIASRELPLPAWNEQSQEA